MQRETISRVDTIKFPVLCFSKYNTIWFRPDRDSLTTVKAFGLKNGLFDKLLIVDSSGKRFHVNGATKLHGVGPLWGYNIFFNQRIKVELHFIGDPYAISLNEVKKLVFRSFRKNPNWATRGDFREFKKSIGNAQSLSTVIELLKA